MIVNDVSVSTSLRASERVPQMLCDCRAKSNYVIIINCDHEELIAVDC
jgi:hypothetical protein